MLKKILALGVTAVLVVSSLTTSASAADFKNGSKGNQILKEHNLTQAYWKNNDKHENNKSVSNIEALKMIIDALDLEDDEESITTLPSTYEGGKIFSIFYYKYIYLALENGILLESETKNFSPYSSIKRYEASKYLLRAVGLEDEAQKYMDADLDFNDAHSVPSDAVGYVYLANKYNLFAVDKNTFQPKKAVSHSEMEDAIEAAKDIDTSDADDIPDETNINSTACTFISLNSTKTKITVMTKEGKNKEYTINPLAQVYFDSIYNNLDYLKAGDTIRLIFSNNNTQVILIEVLSQIRPEESLSTTEMSYEDLPQTVKTQFDSLKQNVNYKAYRYGNYIYLIACRGQKSTGGYDITIKSVAKVLLSNGKYDIKAYVDQVNPVSNTNVTLAITYPYDVVRFNYFDNIQNVNYVDLNGNSIAQTVISSLTDNTGNEQISTTVIQYNDLPDLIKTKVDTLKLNESYTAYKYNNYVYLIAARGQKTTSGYGVDIKNVYKVVQSNNNYDINAYVEKTDPSSGTSTNLVISYPYEVVRFNYFNNIQNVKFVDMNGNSIVQTVLTNLNDTNETIVGTISAVDTSNSKLNVTSGNVTTVYVIPSSAAITLNGSASNISSLTANMNVIITKVNNVITSVAATDNIVETSGTLLAKSTANSVTTLFVKIGNEYKTYLVNSATVFKLNGAVTTLDQIPMNSSVVLREINGVLKEVRAQ